MKELMETIHDIKVGIEADVAVYANGEGFLEFDSVEMLVEDYEITEHSLDRIYTTSMQRQGFELADDQVYVVTHMENGSNQRHATLNHIVYSDLSKQDVLKLIEANLQDYLENYLIIFEQGAYLTVKQYLAIQAVKATPSITISL